MHDDEEVQVDLAGVETTQPPPRSGNGCATAAKWGCGLAMLPVVGLVALLLWASTVKNWELSNGEHMGGSPMNVRFDYLIKGQTSRFHAYFIVVESADGTVLDQNVHGMLNARGTLHFGRFGAPRDVEGPVHVWMEKEDVNRGGRERCSNVLRIRTKD